MRAVVRDRFGPPDVLEIRELDRPDVGADEVLVRVHAASLNPADWHYMTGLPYIARLAFGLRKPRSPRLGSDFAGTVESVGGNVTRLRVGDEVFGGKEGALADYIAVSEDRALKKPSNLFFEEAAAVPVAAVTALQGLRDHGHIQAGQRVLINGSSGGVGTFAVQIAKAFGAEVTGVCSTRNVARARAIGADQVIDYTQEDFTLQGRDYDLMLDIAGNRTWSECKRVLNPRATLVMVGAPDGNPLLGPLSHLVGIQLAGVGSSQRRAFFVATIKRPDLEFLTDLLESGKVKPVIDDRRFQLSEIAEAFRYLGEGHAQGKIVINM